MMGWYLFVAALVGALWLHWWWRRKLGEEQRRHTTRVTQLQEEREAARRQMEARQEALFNSMAEGLLLLDEHGRIQVANRAFYRLFGVNNDVRSKTVIEALRIHELSDFVGRLGGGSNDEQAARELRIARPSERWLEVNGAPLLAPDGSRQGAVIVFHDLTRLKQVELSRKDFVANVSHELRTPLSLIKGYAETLLDGATNNPEVALKFLLSIERNADRLRLLIEDLLIISELESGRVQLDLQPVALRPLIKKIIEDFKARADSKQMNLVEQCPDFQIHGDAPRLEQVLSNLLDNAIKYGRNAGTVRFSARVLPDGFAEVSITDDGPGIPAEALDRIFERFYRVDKARSREQGGTGLGLSIVKHIVQSHGGRVWAESEPGQGATFFFTLPIEGQNRRSES